MAEPSALHPLMLASGSVQSTTAAWITASKLGLYVQASPVHLRLRAKASRSISYYLDNSTLPGSLILNASTGVITGTLPDLTEDTPYSFVVTARTGSAQTGFSNSLRRFTFTATLVAETQPVWQTPPGIIGGGSSGQIFIATLLATDPDELPVGYRFAPGSLLPSGLHFNIATGVVAGILPPVSSDTTYSFTVNATNGFFTVARLFSIVVLLEQTIYWHTPAGNLSTQLQNTLFMTILNASSPDNSTIRYQLINNTVLPGTLTLDPLTGTLYGTLPFNTDPLSNSYPFTINATNGVLNAARSFSITGVSATAAVDPFADNLIALLHMDGDNNSGGFIDTTNNRVIGAGHPYISGFQGLFGGASAAFDGRSRLLVTPTAAHDFDLSATDFTIEYAILFTTLPEIMMAQVQISDGNLIIAYDGQGNLLLQTKIPAIPDPIAAPPLSFPWQPLPMLWNRVAVVCADSIVTVYIDGQSIGNAALSFASGGSTTAAVIGATSQGLMMTGYLDELRITRAARYRGNYIPSAVAFPDVPYWITTTLVRAISEHAYSQPLQGNDPNGDGLSFSIANGSALPLFLSLTAAGSLEGIAGYTANTFSANTTLHLTDGFNGIDHTFNLVVLNSPAPDLGYHGTPISLGTYVERAAVATVIMAASLRNLPLHYQSPDLTALTTLSLDATDGSITGLAPLTPPSNTVTLFSVTVDDGAQAATAQYSISFQHDFPPVWETVTVGLGEHASTVTIAADNTTTLIYTGYGTAPFPITGLHATDVNQGQTISYALASGTLPADLLLAKGIISGSLADVDAMTTSTFSITAFDGYNATEASFAISVLHNIAPVWVTPAGALADVVPTSVYTTTLQATDTNTPVLPLTYHLSSGSLPNGLVFASTGRISGLQTGIRASTTFPITVIVTNGIKSVAQDFSIFVPIDHSVIWITPAGQLVKTVTGEIIRTGIEAISLDLAPVSYSIAADSLPPPLALLSDGQGESIVGRAPPVPADSASVIRYNPFDISVFADNQVNNVAQDFTIIIGDVLPTWSTSSDLGTHFGADNSIIGIHARFAEPVRAILHYGLVSDPADIAPLSLDPDSGQLLGLYPDVTENTVISFVATATDDVNTIEGTFHFAVLVSYAPLWITPSGPLLNTAQSNAITWITDADLGAHPAETSYNYVLSAETAKFSFALAATQPQNRSLTYRSATTLPGTLILHSDGLISGTLLATDSGSFDVTATDGIKTSLAQSFSVSGDANVNPLQYTPSDPPPGGSFTTSLSGIILSGTFPPVTADTTYSFTVTADNGLLAQAQTFTLVNLYPYPSWITPPGNLYTALGATQMPSHANTIVVRAYSPVGRDFHYSIADNKALPPGVNYNWRDPRTQVFYANFSGILPEVMVDTTYTFVMTASDGTFNISNSFTMTAQVNPFLIWKTRPGPIGNVFGGGTYTNRSILAQSATGAITYAIESGLPDGITIVNDTPVEGSPIILSGTLANVDVDTLYSFTATATTAAGFSISRLFSINVLVSDALNNTDFIDAAANDLVLLMHFEGDDQSKVFYDEILHTMHVMIQPNLPASLNEPGPYLSTIRAQAGLSSLYLDGHTAIVTADAPEFDFSTTDWTIECAVLFDTLPSSADMVFSCTAFWITYDGAQIAVHYVPVDGDVTQATFPVGFTTDTWYRIAVQRGSAALSLFIDGHVSGHVSEVPDFALPMVAVGAPYHFPVCIGFRQTLGPPGGFLAMYIDELRITRAARYPDTGYEPSSYPFPTPPAFHQKAGLLGTVLGGVQALLPVTSPDPHNLGLQFLLTAGTLPPPMNLLANGLVEGTPDNPSTDTTYAFDITVTDGLNPVVRGFTILDKFNKPPVWHTQSGPLTTVVSGYALSPDTVSATDPEAYRVSYAIVSGIAPIGTTLNTTTGRLSGVTTASNITQDYVMIITASDGVTAVPRTFTVLSMGNQPPVWTTPSGSLGSLQSGAFFTTMMTASDSNRQAITYSLSGNVPPGLGINAKTGLLSGVLIMANTTTFDFAVVASNLVGPATLPVALTVSPSLAPVSTPVVLSVLGGLQSNVSVTATDPQGLPLNYFIGNPGLPAPLTLDSTTGAITGRVPNPVGGKSYVFVVAITNQARTTSVTETLVVSYNFQPVWQVANNLGGYNGSISIAMTAIDPEHDPVSYSFEGGALPGGVTYDAATSILSGTLVVPPSGDQTYSFSLGASDGVQKNVQTFTLTSRYGGVPLFQSPTPLPVATLNQSYSFGFIMKPNLIQ